MKKGLSAGFIVYLTVSTLCLLVGADRFVGWIRGTKEAVSFRTVRLREGRPGYHQWHQLVERDGQGEEVRTWERIAMDADGFMIPSKIHEDPDITIVFLGGSTTESAAMNEKVRYPYLVGRSLEARLGRTVNSYNAGVSANHVMHSFNVLVHKVLPMKPDVVVLHHNINDFSILLMEGTYWNASPTQSLVIGQRSVWVEGRQFVGRRLIPNLRHWVRKIRGDLFGSVDITKPTSGGSPLPEREPLEAEFASALDLFIDVARRRGIIPVLMTQANRSDGSPDVEVTRFNEYFSSEGGFAEGPFPAWHDAFNEVIRRVGERRGVEVIDLAREVPKERTLFYDLVHYSGRGSTVVAGLVFERLVPLLRSS